MSLPLHLALLTILPAPRLEAVRAVGAVRSDEELVHAALAGERAAQAALYDRHAAAVLGRVTRLLGQRAEAEDVTQEAFVTALGSLARLREPAQFAAWLTQIAVRLVHRRFRRQRLLRRLGFGASVRDASLELLATDADPEIQAQLSRVDQVVRGLDAAHRLAWLLRAVEGCPLAEVAEQCGCSLATAKRRVARAHEQVRAVVAMGPLEELL
jgi:RNA polymerase sigma-70 factor (ECF subfamily)